MLNDEEWAQWPQTKIAEHCAVNQSTVSRIASELGEKSSYAKHKIKKVKRGDQEYTVDTSNIGRRYNREKKPHGGDRKSSGKNYHMKTAQKLAGENNVTEKTVRNYAKDSEFFDELQEKEPLREGEG